MDERVGYGKTEFSFSVTAAAKIDHGELRLARRVRAPWMDERRARDLRLGPEWGFCF